MARDNLAIVKSLLAKTISRGATPGEEEVAVAKAVEMMGKYAIPHSAVASVWPNGWDFQGRRIVESFVAEALRRRDASTTAKTAKTTKTAKTAKTPSPKAMAGSIREYAEYLLRLVHKVSGEAIPYSVILTRIKTQFPGAKTTLASLRWYESNMRAAGRKVPKRKKEPSI